MSTPIPDRPITRVLNSSDINRAIQRANASLSHRQMDFGKGENQWVINDESWDSFTIATDNIGQSRWELWLFAASEGYFHPVHMHLVDYYITRRDSQSGMMSYENLSPKDVLYLVPRDRVWVIVRFDTHKGDYMFHCHNLIHEDNDMMRAMRLIDSQKGLIASTAEPFILNGFANIVYSNWKYINPMLSETSPKPTNEIPSFSSTYIQNMLMIHIYKIFYSVPTDAALHGFTNLWKSRWCAV